MNSWPDEADLAARDQLTADLVALETAQKAWQEFIAIGTNQTLDQFEEALADLSWPDVYSKPEAFNESVAATQEALTNEAAEQAEIEAQRAELEQHIARFESQVAEGHIKAANKANTKVMRLLETAKPTADQRGRTRQLQSKLQELKDWQGFATQPKRDELCEKMQSLASDSAISMPEKVRSAMPSELIQSAIRPHAGRNRQTASAPSARTISTYHQHIPSAHTHAACMRLRSPAVFPPPTAPS